MTAKRITWILPFIIACFVYLPGLSNADLLLGKQPLKENLERKPLTSFSFTQLYGGVIIIKAAIDSLPDSLNFILDTGSGGISLDSLTADLLNIPTIASNRTIRGIAGVKNVRFAYNHTLRLPGLAVDSLDFHINDYEMLSGVYGINIDGIIGYSFFSRYVVGVNFDTKIIQVFTRGFFLKYPQKTDVCCVRQLPPYLCSLPTFTITGIFLPGII